MGSDNPFAKPMNYQQLTQYFTDTFSRGLPLIARGIEERSKSPIEAIAGLALWTLNEEYGSKNLMVIPQRKIGKYTVDFEVTYLPFHMRGCEPLVKIVIECDGHEFHEKTKEQVSRDKKRDRELQKLGYTVLRYSGSDLYNDWRTIRDDVYEVIDPIEKKEIEEWIEQQREKGWM